MSDDSELDELRRDAKQAAQRERKRKDEAAEQARDQAAGTRDAAQRRDAAAAERKRLGVESAGTWHRLRFPLAHDMDGVPWIPLVFAPLALAASVPNLYFKIAALAGLALCLGSMLRSFLRFRSWRAGLPFELKGWQELNERERPPTRERWQRMTVTVELPAPPPAPPPPAGEAPYREVHALTADDDRADHVQAALMVFAERANRAFYASRNEDHKRSEWTVNGLVARGSANAYVLWRLHLLCRGPLALIARKRGSFVVVLTTQGEPEHVSVPAATKR